MAEVEQGEQVTPIRETAQLEVDFRVARVVERDRATANER